MPTVARFTSRMRQTNFTQIFSVTVEVSGSEQAVRQIGVRDELDYPERAAKPRAAARSGKQRHRRHRRRRQSAGQLDRPPDAARDYPSSSRPTSSRPATTDSRRNRAHRAQLNTALRNIWENSSSARSICSWSAAGRNCAINSFVGSNRRFDSEHRSLQESGQRVRKRLRRLPRRSCRATCRRERCCCWTPAASTSCRWRAKLPVQAPGPRRRPRIRPAPRRVHAGAEESRRRTA